MLIDGVACPACHGTLSQREQALACSACGRLYPIVLGIPDLRLTPDPWIGMADDRDKAIAVMAASPPGFEAAVRTYWERTPDTPPHLAARFIEHVLDAKRRSGEWLALLPAAIPGERWLDLGCGTADLACAAPDGVDVVGVDVAFRWLAIAQRRLKEAHCEAALVCGNAESLPFAAGWFDRVIGLGVAEHCEDIGAVLAEAHRVLRPGGSLYLRTVNRYSLLAEPHVGLWGVGWLPRTWADAYVRWRGGAGYQHHWPHGARALHAALRRANFAESRVDAAPLLPSESRRLPSAVRWTVPLYHQFRKVPLASSIARTFAPLLDVTAAVR